MHIASSGKQYHNHAATIYKWAQEDAEKAVTTGNALKKGIPDYSYSEEDCYDGERSLPHKVLRLMEQEKAEKDVEE